jgi:hypothetical protein
VNSLKKQNRNISNRKTDISPKAKYEHFKIKKQFQKEKLKNKHISKTKNMNISKPKSNFKKKN